MKPKCAWIDHEGYQHIEFWKELERREIQVDVGATLDTFLQHFDLNDYPVLLYHPGIRQQHRIKEVVERYPNTTVALIIDSCSLKDYRQFEIPVLNYDVDSVERFIRDCQ